MTARTSRRTTALDQYQRLECTGLWRDDPNGQRREVIVSLGEASLIMTDRAGRAVSHWSLPAVERTNPDDLPAVFRPGSDAAEELELDDALMVGAIEKVRNAVERRRAHPGRLRHGLVGAGLLALAGLLIFWLPGAMLSYTASVVPEAKRAEIGAAVLAHVRRVTGGECRAPGPELALRRLAVRLRLPPASRIAVLAGGTRLTAHLPGGLILVNRSLVEDYDTADVLAGFVIAERARAIRHDPLLELLAAAGLRATFRLLTTGDLPPQSLAAYGERLMTDAPGTLPAAELLVALASAQVPASPYAFALDPTGEATVDLIEADPYSGGGAPPLIPDADWVSVQGICGE